MKLLKLFWGWLWVRSVVNWGEGLSRNPNPASKCEKQNSNWWLRKHRRLHSHDCHFSNANRREKQIFLTIVHFTHDRRVRQTPPKLLWKILRNKNNFLTSSALDPNIMISFMKFKTRRRNENENSLSISLRNLCSNLKWSFVQTKRRKNMRGCAFQ